MNWFTAIKKTRWMSYEHWKTEFCRNFDDPHAKDSAIRKIEVAVQKTNQKTSDLCTVYVPHAPTLPKPSTQGSSIYVYLLLPCQSLAVLCVRAKHLITILYLYLSSGAKGIIPIYI